MCGTIWIDKERPHARAGSPQYPYIHAPPNPCVGQPILNERYGPLPEARTIPQLSNMGPSDAIVSPFFVEFSRFHFEDARESVRSSCGQTVGVLGTSAACSVGVLRPPEFRHGSAPAPRDAPAARNAAPRPRKWANKKPTVPSRWTVPESLNKVGQKDTHHSRYSRTEDRRKFFNS